MDPPSGRLGCTFMGRHNVFCHSNVGRLCVVEARKEVVLGLLYRYECSLGGRPGGGDSRGGKGDGISGGGIAGPGEGQR